MHMRTRTVTKACLGAGLSLLLAGTAQAQDPRIEIGGSAGWTLSDGVTFAGVLAGDGQVYNGIEPKDSFSWSLNIGYLTSPNTEIGFLFSQQKSTLAAWARPTTAACPSPWAASPARRAATRSSRARSAWA
jgi:hypothetical protein